MADKYAFVLLSDLKRKEKKNKSKKRVVTGSVQVPCLNAEEHIRDNL